MDLSRSSQLLVVGLKETFLGLELGTAHPVIVEIGLVLHYLPDWVILVRELLRHGDRIVNRLLPLARAPIPQQAEHRVILLSRAKLATSSSSLLLILLSFLLASSGRGLSLGSPLLLLLLILLCWLLLFFLFSSCGRGVGSITEIILSGLTTLLFLIPFLFLFISTTFSSLICSILRWLLLLECLGLFCWSGVSFDH